MWFEFDFHWYFPQGMQASCNFATCSSVGVSVTRLRNCTGSIRQSARHPVFTSHRVSTDWSYQRSIFESRLTAQKPPRRRRIKCGRCETRQAMGCQKHDARFSNSPECRRSLCSLGRGNKRTQRRTGQVSHKISSSIKWCWCVKIVERTSKSMIINKKLLVLKPACCQKEWIMINDKPTWREGNKLWCPVKKLLSLAKEWGIAGFG